ncbi:MAG: DUF4175 family protein, partial [Alsobacter sp.]
MSDDASARSAGNLEDRAARIATRVAKLARQARLVLAWEALWPVLASALAIAGVFVAASWFGVWGWLPLWARPVGVGLTALALLACVVVAIRLPRPDWRAALGRLDRDSALPHRPATALTDPLASSADDPTTRAIWEAHRARVLDSAAKLTVSRPAPRLAERDPWAVRFAVAFTVMAAFFVAGPERKARLAEAFDWSGTAAQAAGFRLDGWIDPPAYTQVPPVLLDL